MWCRPRAFAIAFLSLFALPGCGEDDGGASSDEPPASLYPGGATTNTLLLGRNAFLRPVENITEANEPKFFTGNSFFNQAWVQAPSSTQVRDGLGPLFNARSCAACHLRDGRGAPPLEQDEPFLGLLLRLSLPGAGPDEAPVPDPNYGGQLQPFALSDVPAEGRPEVTYEEVSGAYDDGTGYTLLAPTYVIHEPAYGPLPDELMVSPRVAPQMIGLGLLEAIPEARLAELADPDDADDDGISGRINMVMDATAGALRPGRFGWKGDAPSIRQQTAGALLGDLGITSPVFGSGECTDAQPECAEAHSGGAPEVEEANFERMVIYSSLLAVPIRRNHTAEQVLQGEALFTEAGCGACHVPDHQTGEHVLPELVNQHIWPYTDLLLHDMGEGLADHRPVFGASGTEWKTPPLWGIGLFDAVNGHTRLLHDGRARGVAEAILWHDGEGQEARDRFKALSVEDRAALVRFVESL